MEKETLNEKVEVTEEVKTESVDQKPKKEKKNLIEIANDCNKKVDSFFGRIGSKILPFLDKHKYLFFIIFITAACIAMRYVVGSHFGNDYKSFLQPWVYYMKINGGGLTGLSSLYQNAPIDPPNLMFIEELGVHCGVAKCDYPPLYMYMLSLISYLPLGGRVESSGIYFANLPYYIKTVSFIFEILAAVYIYKIIKTVTKSDLKASIGYTLFFILPTVFVNSALWAQCDICYTSMLIISIYYLMKKRPSLSVLFFALAFGFKLQAIFLLPVFGFLWFRRSFKLRNLLIVPLVLVVTFIPLWCTGGGFDLPFKPYMGQLNGYSALTLNAPNLWQIVDITHYDQNVESLMSIVAMILTVVVCLTTIVALAIKKVKVNEKSILVISTFFLVLVPFVMPHMHERYFYSADIMLMVLAVCYLKRIALPVLMQAASIIGIYAYGNIITSSGWTNLDKANYLKLGATFVLVILGFLVYDMAKLEVEETPTKNLEITAEPQ